MAGYAQITVSRSEGCGWVRFGALPRPQFQLILQIFLNQFPSCSRSWDDDRRAWFFPLSLLPAVKQFCDMRFGSRHVSVQYLDLAAA